MSYLPSAAAPLLRLLASRTPRCTRGDHSSFAASCLDHPLDRRCDFLSEIYKLMSEGVVGVVLSPKYKIEGHFRIRPPKRNIHVICIANIKFDSKDGSNDL